MTQEEAVKKITEIVKGLSHFKIGKTGQKRTERFDSAYKDQYSAIRTICTSDKKTLIDQWEKDLIAYFRNHPDFKDKCDNDQEGSGEMTDSSEYQIYVVFKD